MKYREHLAQPNLFDRWQQQRGLLLSVLHKLVMILPVHTNVYRLFVPSVKRSLNVVT